MPIILNSMRDDSFFQFLFKTTKLVLNLSLFKQLPVLHEISSTFICVLLENTDDGGKNSFRLFEKNIHEFKIN